MTNKSFIPFPVLKTERLTLRQLVSGDDNEIFTIRSDNNINRYLDRKRSKTIEDAKTFIQTVTENIKKNDSIYWAISFKGKNELIGTTCLFNFSDDNLTSEIGYELLPDFQGKGLMQEAIAKVIEFGFQNIGLNFIEAYTHSENQRSIKLLERFNFKRQPGTDKITNKNFVLFKSRKNDWKDEE